MGKDGGTNFPDRGGELKLSASVSLTRMLWHIELSEVTESETAPNRSLMDLRDERPATKHRAEEVGSVGELEGCRSEVGRSLLPTNPNYHPLLCHSTEERLMIINTLKHLRSGGSECTPER